MLRENHRTQQVLLASHLHSRALRQYFGRLHSDEPMPSDFPTKRLFISVAALLPRLDLSAPYQIQPMLQLFFFFSP